MGRVWGTYWADPDKLRSYRLNLATLRRATSFMRPYRGLLVLFLIVTAADSLVNVVPALWIRRIIDHALPNRDSGELLALCGLLALAYVVGTALTLGQSRIGAEVGASMVLDLRQALFDHVQRMPLAFFTRTHTGIIQSRFNNDVGGVTDLVVEDLSGIVNDLLGLASTITVMTALSWQVTVAVLVLVPLFLVPAEFVGHYSRALNKKQMKQWGEMNTVVAERFNVAGSLLTKLFGTFAPDLRAYTRHARRVRDTAVDRAMIGTVFVGALSLVGSLAVVAIYLFGGRSVIAGALTLGTVVALATLAQRIYTPVVDLASTRIRLVQGLVAFERVYEVLDAPLAIQERPGALSLKRVAGRVEVRDVWFRYPAPAEVSIASMELDAEGETRETLSTEPGEWLLRGVSLTAEPGTMTAVVGVTGVGKTSLCYLLARLYDVTRGAVLIDGNDVRDLSFETLNRAVGMVTQDPHLHHDTVAANLRLGRPDATDDMLAKACRVARIADLVESLPDRYQTIAGERGYRFSGGEKQRLAIARVILKNPAVIILDEATSHLDNETEALVQEALNAALRGRTSIVIAHRLSTIQGANQILVLEDGRVRERGAHTDLLRAGGLYATLHRRGDRS